MTDTGDTLAPGTRLDELKIERVLGAGGFGVTYLARDVSLDAWRAVKEYLPRDWGTRLRDGTIGPRTGADAEDYQWGLTRFLDEARILAQFDHPNLVRVYRVFEAQGTAYMVTEYVEGRTLAAALRESGPWSERQVRELLKALTDGLSAVHVAGLLHRDIKPGNVMVRGDGTPVLIDFGSARQAMGRQSRSVTAVLTPGYAPLEQYSPRGNQGPWTDIYALGALAYEALSGQVPDDATERVAEDLLRPLAEAAAQPVSAELAAAVDAALAVHKEDRPQSLDAWRALLAGMAGVSPVSSRPRGGAAAGTVGGDAGAERSGRAAAGALVWRQWWLPGTAAAGLVGVALVVALTAPWSRSGPEETPAPPPDPVAVAELGENAAEQAAAEQAAAEQAVAEQVAAAQAAAEQAAAEQAAAEQVAAAQAAAEQAAAEQAAAEQVAAAQAAAEQAAAEQAAAEQAAAEQVAAAQAAAAEQAAAEQQRLADMRRPGRVFRDCPTCPELVVVPAGRYQMGSDPRDEDSEIDERPRHPVTVDTFALGRYEVTREEYAAFVAATQRTMSGGCFVMTVGAEGTEFSNDRGRSWRDPGFEQGDGHPAVCVSWEDAQAYARWLSEQTGQDYRLASEAEWEYAARGGTQGRWYWGNDTGEQCGYANGLDTSFAAAYPPGDGKVWTNRPDCDDRVAQTAPAGSYIPNDFGLHDMSGNVWEWLEDCWHENYARAPSDGTAWTSGGDCGRRVLRGGSRYDVPGYLRSALRYWIASGLRFTSYGFRVARTLTP